MLEPDTADEVGRRESPEQWERRRQGILRRAHEARTRALRDLFGAISRPILSVATGVRRLVAFSASQVAAAARRPAHAYATWRLRRQAIGELASLDDRMLKDFGISRSEIEAVVYGRDREPKPEGKIAARLFHKPYDRPAERRSPATSTASKQRISKNAA